MQEENNGGLIILGIEAKDFRCLKAAKFRFSESGIQIIAGKNGAGKSTVTEGLRAIFSGMTNSIPMPIREGADEALYSFQLQKSDGTVITVECVWTDAKTKSGNRKKPVLKVKNTDGSAWPDGSAMLKALLGDIKFNLAEFIGGTTPEHARFRRDAIMKTVPGLDEKLTALVTKREAIFDKRTDVGREITRLAGKFDSMEGPEKGLPETESSISVLTNKAQELGATLSRRRACETKITIETNVLSDTARKLNEAQVALRRAEQVHEDQKRALAHAQGAITEFPENLDAQIAANNNVLATAEETNRKIREAKAYQNTQVELSNAQSLQNTLTTEIEAVDKQKSHLLDAAEFPISSLSVDETDITYKDKPWSVAATSQRMKVALATGFAQQPKPDLRALFVPDGNRFDPDSLKLIDEIAREQKFQVLLEYVVADKSEADKVKGFYIEDGEVVAPSAAIDVEP